MSRRSHRVIMKRIRKSRRIRGLSPEPVEQKSTQQITSKSQKKAGNLWTFNFTITDDQKEQMERENFVKKVTINLDHGPDVYQNNYCFDVRYYGIQHKNGRTNYGEPVMDIVNLKICNVARILQLHSFKWGSSYWNWYTTKSHDLGVIHQKDEIIAVEGDLYIIDWQAVAKQQFVLFGYEEQCTLFGGTQIRINEQKLIERVGTKITYFYGRNMYMKIASRELGENERIIAVLYYMNSRKNKKSIDTVLGCCTKLLMASNFKDGTMGKIYQELGGDCWYEMFEPKLKGTNTKIRKNKSGRFLFEVGVTINNEDEIVFDPPFLRKYFVVESAGVINFGAEITMDFNPKNGKLRINFALLQQLNDTHKTVLGQDILEKELYEGNQEIDPNE
eukprot:361062_1